MEVVFDIATSLQFWRKRYLLDRAPQLMASTTPAHPVCSARDVRALAPAWAMPSCDGEKLHVLVFGRDKVRRSPGHVTHVWSGFVPERSFLEPSPGVFVETPEFMFMRAATMLGFHQLVAFGDELCGLYSFDDQVKRGFRKRLVPLTSTEKLEWFLRGASGCSGAKDARRALPFVMERSASPMETFDEMTMCLPYRYGGYGIAVPTMNQEVLLSERARRIARRDKCYLDLGYLERCLDIEHHGKLDHSSPEDRESDFARVSGLREMGIEVIELDWNTVSDLRAYEYVIQRIAKILGKRIEAKYLGPRPERLSLRQAVKVWNASSGKVI